MPQGSGPTAAGRWLTVLSAPVLVLGTGFRAEISSWSGLAVYVRRNSAVTAGAIKYLASTNTQCVANVAGRIDRAVTQFDRELN